MTSLQAYVAGAKMSPGHLSPECPPGVQKNYTDLPRPRSPNTEPRLDSEFPAPLDLSQLRKSDSAERESPASPDPDSVGPATSGEPGRSNRTLDTGTTEVEVVDLTEDDDEMEDDWRSTPMVLPGLEPDSLEEADWTCTKFWDKFRSKL